MNRFIEAQKKYFLVAKEELKKGRKESHWMWFIFPQIIGLGKSETSIYYSIKSIKEARLYMENEYLRKNYDCLCRILLRLEENDAVKIFGYTDSLKLHSSLTLFHYVTNKKLYKKVLNKFYAGKLDFDTSLIIAKMKGQDKDMDEKWTINDLGLTEEQGKFLTEHNLVEIIKETISQKSLINIDIDDYKMILRDREIVGYVYQQSLENVRVNLFKEVENPDVILYICGAITLFVTNQVVESLRSQLKNMNCIYGIGQGEDEKVFALITGKK